MTNLENVKANRAKKRAFINQLKDNPCVDCGGRFHPEAMHFDHLRDKKRGIADLTTCSVSRILDEVQKCELVCANCHAVRTYNRRWRVVDR